MKRIAIIPARSGSKGLKDKNIKLINGKALIYYSIQAAIESKCFDEIYVSTDSDIYKKIALECGANVPFLRDEKNAGDKSSSWDVVEECIIKYKGIGREFDEFMLLQPTSPLRTADDIINAINLKNKNKADTIISITVSESSPLVCTKLPLNHSLSKFCNSKYFNYRRQDLPEYYKLNGAIYLAETEKFLLNKTIYKGKILGYIMSKENSIDIDDEIDFNLAEIYLKKRVTKNSIC